MTTLGDEEDDEEENFKDVALDTDDEADTSKEAKTEVADEESAKENKVTAGSKSNGIKDASWIHKKNIIFKKHDKYDPTERNPLYCGADKTLTFELLPFTRHYHPTVVVFANKLLNVSWVFIPVDKLIRFLLMIFW